MVDDDADGDAGVDPAPLDFCAEPAAPLVADDVEPDDDEGDGEDDEDDSDLDPDDEAEDGELGLDGLGVEEGLGIDVGDDGGVGGVGTCGDGGDFAAQAARSSNSVAPMQAARPGQTDAMFMMSLPPSIGWRRDLDVRACAEFHSWT